MRPLLGASFFSAAGSLPLQVLPFLVLSLVIEGRVDVSVAGWVGSAFLLGMLTSALLLPLLRISRLDRWQAVSAIAVIEALLYFSVGTIVWALLLCQWFVIGFACGALQFLGATAAAASHDRPRAFALRLSVTLVLASAVIVCLSQLGNQAGYSVFADFLAGAFLVMALLGACLYANQSPPTASSATSSGATSLSISGDLSGLFVVFLFFVGQPGFWAYSMQSAAARGLELQYAAWVMAAVKIVSALTLLRRPTSGDLGSSLANLLASGVSIGGGIYLMSSANTVVTFFIGFLLWEVALNLVSARLQGLVVAANPMVAGAWITGAMLLGAATGPVVHGAMIAWGAELTFLSYSALSGLFPLMWVAYRRTIP